MYFWNVKALAEDLRADKVTEKEKASYLMVFLLLLSLFFSVPYLFPLTVTNGFDYLIALITIISMVGSAWWAYDANKRGDNQHFVERYVCLDLPITIRLVVLTLVLVIPYILIGSMIWGEDFYEILETTWLDVVFTAIPSILVVLWFRKWMAVASRKAE